MAKQGKNSKVKKKKKKKENFSSSWLRQKKKENTRNKNKIFLAVDYDSTYLPVQS